jgi:hypothetical protein
MRQRFEWSSTHAIAPLTALMAVLVVTAAKAGEGVSAQNLAASVQDQKCGAPGETCAHISGYIKAGSDSFARDPDLQRPARVATPPFMAGAGVMGSANALNRGIFFLEVSHDQQAR